MDKKAFWAVMKKARPYIIIDGILCGILGGLAAYNYISIKNTARQIEANRREFERLARECPNRIKLDELDGDDRKPIEPTPIYIYD